MSPETFRIQMGRMYSLFGEKTYPQERLESIWQFCQDLPDHVFRQMVNSFIDDAKSAPLPKEFKSLAASYFAKNRGFNQEPETKPSAQARCWDCGDSGNAFANKKSNGASYVFRCHCRIGGDRPKAQGAQWSAHFEAEYELQPLYKKNQGDWKPKPDQTATQMLAFLRGRPVEGVRKGHLASIKEIVDPAVSSD